MGLETAQNKEAHQVRCEGQSSGLIFGDDFGRLAQLVQSTCLTSRGSLVRIQHRPREIWEFSSVWLECFLDMEEVVGPNPTTPTKEIPCRIR